MNQVLEKIAECGLVPVVKLDNAQNALPLAESLCRAGLPIAEITFRTEAAADSIVRIRKAFPDMLVGAGTIVNCDQAKRAVDVGAAFLVSPGFSSSVTAFAQRTSLPILPGACTPTELMMLLEAGLTVAKFFPCKQYGGLATIQALSAPFPQMRFMPTGGIDAGNLVEYLSCPKVLACGGSWMVKESLIAAKDFAKIEQLTRDALAVMGK